LQNAIVGNIFRNNGMRGLEIYGEFGDCYGNVVVGNVIIDNGTQGIRVNQATKNTIVGNVVHNNGEHGILIDGENCRDIVVAGNVIDNNGWVAANNYDGININYAKHIAIFANRITDDKATKTQRYAIRSANTSDYLYIVDNDITGNLNTISLVGTNNIVKGNIGYDTENFKATGLSVSIGLSGAYGSATAITSRSGRITYPRVKITWGGTFGSGETVTVKVEAVYTDGTTAYVEKSATAVGSLWLTDDDVLTLIANDKDIVKLNIYAKTSLASTSVTVTINSYGKG
jgi:parallel beta-helix repeat protein